MMERVAMKMKMVNLTGNSLWPTMMTMTMKMAVTMATAMTIIRMTMNEFHKNSFIVIHI